jgi:hypothetical protein
MVSLTVAFASFQSLSLDDSTSLFSDRESFQLLSCLSSSLNFTMDESPTRCKVGVAAQVASKVKHVRRNINQALRSSTAPLTTASSSLNNKSAFNANNNKSTSRRSSSRGERPRPRPLALQARISWGVGGVHGPLMLVKKN